MNEWMPSLGKSVKQLEDLHIAGRSVNLNDFEE